MLSMSGVQVILMASIASVCTGTAPEDIEIGPDTLISTSATESESLYRL